MKGDAPFSPRGPFFLLDTMWAGAGGPPNPTLLARNAYVEMIKTAQNVADRYELSREEIDAFALRSHQPRRRRPGLGPAGRRDPPRRHPRHPAGSRLGRSSTTRSSGATPPPSSWPPSRPNPTRPR